MAKVANQIRIGSPQKKCVVIIKADEDVGFSAKNLTGKIELSYVNDLLLTDSQKLQKIGVFIKNTDNTEIHVFDQQSRNNDGIYKANYFADVFLGCKQATNAANQTQKIYNGIQSVIPNLPLSEIEKIRLRDNLNSYIDSNEDTISLDHFANLYVKQDEVKDILIETVQENTKITSPIAKNIKLIENQIKRSEINFDNQIRIVGPRDSIGANFEVEQEGDGYVVIRIRGNIKQK